MKLLLLSTPILLLCLFAADAAPKSLDVTQKIIAAVKNNTLSLAVNNTTLPAIEADPPKLRITYQLTNRVRVRTWMDGQTVSLAAPSGQPLAITHADYGQFDDAVDVTSTVAALIKDNALPSTTVDDQSMECDPNHGVSKQLVIRYAIGGEAGKQKMMSVEQSEDIKIPAPPDGQKLTIIEATYGLPVTYFDVTDMVADLLQGNTLNITPTDDLFGDPAPGMSGKKLQITYIQTGETHTASADAGQPLTLKPANATPMIILKATWGVN